MKRLILAALLSLFAFAVPAEAAACCDAVRAATAGHAATSGLTRRPLPNGGGRLPILGALTDGTHPEPKERRLVDARPLTLDGPLRLPGGKGCSLFISDRLLRQRLLAVAVACLHCQLQQEPHHG